jgi:K+-transporting ATPase ATPase C chain
MSILRPAIVLLLLLALLTGVLYPAVLTLAAGLLFPARAGGSLVVRDGVVTGSELLGQAFTDPSYFQGRPSATAVPYDAAASSGSNLGPTNPALRAAVAERAAALRAANPGQDAPIPLDLVTASASGLDPHVSPEAALWQVPRVARARGLSEEDVRAFVLRHVEGRTLGILGEPRVNVLLLNLALDGG